MVCAKWIGNPCIRMFSYNPDQKGTGLCALYVGYLCYVLVMAIIFHVLYFEIGRKPFRLICLGSVAFVNYSEVYQ